MSQLHRLSWIMLRFCNAGWLRHHAHAQLIDAPKLHGVKVSAENPLKTEAGVFFFAPFIDKDLISS